MVIVSAIMNVFSSLVVIVIAVIELFYVRIGLMDVIGIFVIGLLNIIYACLWLYALRLHQRAIEQNWVIYYDTEDSEAQELIQEMETAV